MEKNFYQDNFEQLLKETTDNFRMYPSKRVWHSIYNDLHPSRKWPSLAIWLLLISSVVFVGLSNRNQARFNKPAGSPVASLTAEKPQATPLAAIGNSTLVKPITSKKTVDKQGILHNFSNETTLIDTRLNPLNNSAAEQDPESANVLAFYKNSLTGKSTSAGNDDSGNLADAFAKSSITIGSRKATGLNDGSNEPGEQDKDLLASKAAKKDDAKKDFLKINSNTQDKEWIEDFAFHNKPAASKWKSKISYELYTTPSVGYRTMKQNTPYRPVVSSSLIANSNANQDFEDAVSQVAAINMELGGNVLYSISNKLNLKIGLQLNYTNYNINAYELKHPTMTTLMLNDLNTGLPELSPRSTTLANTEGVYSKKLNNNTYQISLPLGADIKLAGNDNLKWFAGATIQPTYIVDGNAYYISSDLKNYVSDNSLMRKWNLNAGVETFISYKTKSGIILNAGPQFRYQFLSTYSKKYTYDEKLYNLGLKIGIITRF